MPRLNIAGLITMGAVAAGLMLAPFGVAAVASAEPPLAAVDVVEGVLAVELLELELDDPVSLFVVPHAARNSRQATRLAAAQILLVFIKDPRFV